MSWAFDQSEEIADLRRQLAAAQQAREQSHSTVTNPSVNPVDQKLET